MRVLRDAWLSDADWAHDRTDHRSMGEVVEKSKAEQEAKAPASAQCVEKQTDKREWNRIGGKNTSEICVQLKKGSDEGR